MMSSIVHSEVVDLLPSEVPRFVLFDSINLYMQDIKQEECFEHLQNGEKHGEAVK